MPTRAQRLAALSEVLPSAAFPTGVLALVADYAQPILLFSTGPDFHIRMLDISTQQLYREFFHSKLRTTRGSALLPIPQHQLLLYVHDTGVTAWELHGSQYPVAELDLPLPSAICFLPARQELVVAVSWGLCCYEVPSFKLSWSHAIASRPRPFHTHSYGTDELLVTCYNSSLSLFSLTTKVVTSLTLLDGLNLGPPWSTPHPLLSPNGVLALVAGDQLHAASLPPQRGASPTAAGKARSQALANATRTHRKETTEEMQARLSKEVCYNFNRTTGLACPPLCNAACRMRDWFMDVCDWPSAVIISVDPTSSGVSSSLRLWMPERSSALHDVRVVDAGGAALELNFSKLVRISSDLFVALGAAGANKRHHTLFFIKLSQAAPISSSAPSTASSSSSSASASASASASSGADATADSARSAPHVIARVLGSFTAGNNFRVACALPL
jgi:hypothetical protein